MNVAVTERACVIDTVHAPLPLHAPLQPENVELLAGDGVSVTEVPFAKAALQALPQLMPAGCDVTTPVPVPAFVTLSV